MEALKKDGVYEITPEMKEKLSDFEGGYSTEEETKETIGATYKSTGYVMDTHTAVAAHVSRAYRDASKDQKKDVGCVNSKPL